MSDLPLQWHPQWLVYHHGEQGIALINKTDMVWLPFEQFKGIEYINGERSDSDVGLLLAQSQPPSNGAMFWYQLPKLIQSDLVTKNPQLQQFYLSPSIKEASLLCASTHIEVFNLSDNELFWLQDLANVLVEAFGHSGSNEQYAQGRKLALLLVDDFLNEQIQRQVEQLTDDHQQVMIVEVVAPDLVFSPCFNRVDFTQLWRNTTGRIWENQPVRRVFSDLYPETSFRLPVLQFDTTISSPAKKWLAQYLASHCKNNDDSMLFVDLVAFEDAQTFDSYTGLTKGVIAFNDCDSDAFAQQLGSAVVLNSCMSVFDSDGGSRAMTPEQTVRRLLPLVNDKTGVVTHLNTFDNAQDNPIKIYRTAFYKTPTPKQCENLSGELFTQTCMGKGVSDIQSQASALCETIERYNAHFRDDVHLFAKRQSQLESFAACIGYERLLPYSQSQFNRFTGENHPDSKLKQAAIRYDDSSVYWLPVWSLSSSQKTYVPLSLCFSQVPFDDERFGRWSSNGCAAGNCLEEAILQGLLELIERDAVAIWWYNRTVRQAFDLSRLNQGNLATLDQSLSLTHDYWVLDISTDIGVPAMVAIGVDKKTNGFILGMGCHLSPELAAQRALTELCQLIPIRDQNGAPFDFDAIEKAPYLYPAVDGSPSRIAQACHDKDIQKQVHFIVTVLTQLNMDTLVLNYSRAHVPLHTAKVFVPGLCHIWPQLGNQRLYQTPVKQGLRTRMLNEQQINPLPLYI